MEEIRREKWQGISGSTLKLIAVLVMLTDHIAATVLLQMAQRDGAGAELARIYDLMRDIGRSAFPIYCYMLVEGLEHTHSRAGYAARLCLFALISEIPFDLAFYGQLFYPGHQNVFFTLAIALGSMMGLEALQKHRVISGKDAPDRLIRGLLALLDMAGAMALAQFLGADYSWAGVACILVMYLLRQNRGACLVMGYLAFLLLLGEFETLPAFLLLALYRGKKGFSAKYFFYAFYPVHLILLYLTCILMNLLLQNSVFFR